MWDLLDGTSKVTHHLVRGDEAPEVVLADGVEIGRGEYVRAYGHVDDDGVFVVEDHEVLIPNPQYLIDPEQRDPRRLATILVFWAGQQAGLTNADAKDRMFGPYGSTNVFYQEISYGKEKMAGEVFGPYEIDDPGGCDTQFIAAAARTAMADHGHNELDYKQFMYWFPGADCDFSGLASVGRPDEPREDSWYNGAFGCVVRNQEIGHNYGMAHSKSYSCTDKEGLAVPFSSECEFSEYGDPYDPMGHGCAHMNVSQKHYMGWLEGCNVVTAKSTARFNLLPTELPCDGIQALKVPTHDGRFYILEYRQPLGAFDDFGGVQIRVTNEFGGRGPDPFILTVDGSRILHTGDSYVGWGEAAPRITVAEEHETHAVIEVEFFDGGSGEAECDDGERPDKESGAFGILKCADEPIQPDIVAPKVEIVQPEDGDWFEPGAAFDILVEAEDERGLTELVLYVDGEPFSYRLFEGPWAWGVTDIPEGVYEFGVVARDGPNWTPSNAVTITVSADRPQAGDTGEADDGTEDPADGGTGGADAGEDDPAGADDSGCGCRQRGSGPPALALLLLGGLAFTRRRSRSAAQ